MVKELKELQDTHRAYEEKVNIKHKVSDDERVECKVSALVVEFGELANESESFFKFFKINHRNDKKKKLKEAADCLAYFLGLSNDLKIQLDIYKWNINTKVYDINKHFKNAVGYATNIKSIREIAIESIDIEGHCTNVKRNEITLKLSFTSYLYLLESLGIDFEEVKTYYKEYVVKDNVKRQEEEY